jgi:hypothetical protein
MFANLDRESGRRRALPGRPRDRKRRPSLESLEVREMMSLGAEFLAPVNTTTRNNQFESDNASSAGGTSVVVWTDTYSSTDHDIRAQRFNSFGGASGPEIVVSFSGLDEGSPAVAMDDQGRFVVTWVQKYAGGDTNVVARQFDSDGNAVGDLIAVGAGTFRESDPDVATDLAGNFVVSYTRDTNNNNPDVFAKRYNSSGQLLNVVDVATSTTRAENHSSVAMTPDGRFAVAWENAFTATDHDIILSRYNAYAGLVDVTGIGNGSQNDVSPSVAMDNNGNGVVVWERAGNIQARRFDSSGAPAFYDFTIAGTSATERNASVAMRRGGGGFVVAYESLSSGTRTKVAEVSAFNSVTTQDAGTRSAPAVSINAFGDYLLTYTSPDGSDQNIRGRRGYLPS